MNNFTNNYDGRNWDVTITGTHTGASIMPDDLTCMTISTGEYQNINVDLVLANKQLADGPGGVDGVMVWLRSEEGNSILVEIRAELIGYEGDKCQYSLWAEYEGKKINFEID